MFLVGCAAILSDNSDLKCSRKPGFVCQRALTICPMPEQETAFLPLLERGAAHRNGKGTMKFD
jgi:hypothetical protein